MNGFPLTIKSVAEHGFCTDKRQGRLKRKTLEKLISEDQPWLTFTTVTISWKI